MKNITIKEYFELEDKMQYDLILDALGQRKEFNDKTYDEKGLSYSEVKYSYKLIPQFDKNPDSICKLYKILYKISEDEFYSSSIVELFSTLKKIISIFNELKMRELKLLSHAENDEDSQIWEAAGGSTLSPFSEVLPLIELGKHFGVYPYDLFDKNYEEILVMLAALKRQNQVIKEFQRLKTMQNKK